MCSTALGSYWRACMLKWLQVKVALRSFTRTFIAMGHGWDHHMKLPQLILSHFECSGTWTWPESQESFHHISASHATPFALISSPNAWCSFPKCWLLVPPTERAMLTGLVQLARLGIKTLRTKNTWETRLCWRRGPERKKQSDFPCWLSHTETTMRVPGHVWQNKTILPLR